MAPSSILAAAVGAALALAACTPERHTADDSRPAPSASSRVAGDYGSGGAAGTAAGAARRKDGDSNAEARGSTSGEGETGDSESHGGFGDSGTAGAGG